jgi:acetolactate synthase-1/2/3 large subunit
LKVSEYIARYWAAREVRNIFLVPTSLFDSLVALDEVGGVRRILAHTEKGAGYMADGHAQATRRPGVVISQPGQAVANMAAGLADAWLSSTAVIAFTNLRLQKDVYRNRYQDIPFDVSSVVKWKCEIRTPNRTPDLMDQAWREATTGEPRPVYVFVDPAVEHEDIEADVARIDPRFSTFPAHRPVAAPEDLKAALDLLAGAERPLLILGGGVVRSGAQEVAAAFARELGVPVATTVAGKGSIPESDPLSVGVVGNYGMRVVRDFCHEADVALIVGTRTGSQSTDDWRLPGSGVRIIHLNINGAEIGRNLPTEVGLVGDAKSTLEALSERARTRELPSWSGWAERAREARAHAAAVKRPYRQSDATPMRPERVCAEISRALPPNGRVVADTGYAAAWAAMHIELSSPEQDFFATSGALGWGVAASIGVQAAEPTRPVVCVTGDGGFWYHCSELETAARYGLNVIVVVLNNACLAFDRHFLDVTFGNRAYDLADFSRSEPASVAEGLGCLGLRANTPDEFVEAFRTALSAGRPSVIDARITEDAVPSIGYYTSGGLMSAENVSRGMEFDEAGELVTIRRAHPREA